jgi:hypothetical protein
MWVGSPSDLPPRRNLLPIQTDSGVCAWVPSWRRVVPEVDPGGRHPSQSTYYSVFAGRRGPRRSNERSTSVPRTSRDYLEPLRRCRRVGPKAIVDRHRRAGRHACGAGPHDSATGTGDDTPYAAVRAMVMKPETPGERPLDRTSAAPGAPTDPADPRPGRSVKTPGPWPWNWRRAASHFRPVVAYRGDRRPRWTAYARDPASAGRRRLSIGRLRSLNGGEAAALVVIEAVVAFAARGCIGIPLTPTRLDGRVARRSAPAACWRGRSYTKPAELAGPRCARRSWSAVTMG